MGNERPRIAIPMSVLDIMVEAFAALGVLFNVVLVGYAWARLPAVIPSHFNTSGQIDGYGSKNSLVVLVALILVFYLLLSLLARFPHIYNYIIEITEQNAEVQYKLSVRLMRFLKLEFVLIFSYIQFAMVSTALNHKFLLGMFFLPVSLFMVSATLVFYIYRSIKGR